MLCVCVCVCVCVGDFRDPPVFSIGYVFSAFLGGNGEGLCLSF